MPSALEAHGTQEVGIQRPRLTSNEKLASSSLDSPIMFSLLRVRRFCCPERSAAHPCSRAPLAPSPGQPGVRAAHSAFMFTPGCGRSLPGECSLRPYLSVPDSCWPGLLRATCHRNAPFARFAPQPRETKATAAPRPEGHASWPSRPQGKERIPDDTCPPGPGRPSCDSHRGLLSPLS